jgi:hypothetical protein
VALQGHRFEVWLCGCGNGPPPRLIPYSAPFQCSIGPSQSGDGAVHLVIAPNITEARARRATAPSTAVRGMQGHFPTQHGTPAGPCRGCAVRAANVVMQHHRRGFCAPSCVPGATSLQLPPAGPIPGVHQRVGIGFAWKLCSFVYGPDALSMAAQRCASGGLDFLLGYALVQMSAGLPQWVVRHWQYFRQGAGTVAGRVSRRAAPPLAARSGRRRRPSALPCTLSPGS